MVGLKTDSNMWKVRLLLISSVIYCPSSKIRKCYDPKTIGYFAPLKPCFRFQAVQWHFPELEADY